MFIKMIHEEGVHYCVNRIYQFLLTDYNLLKGGLQLPLDRELGQIFRAPLK